MKQCLAIFCILLMTGCSGRISLSDVATAGGAVAGAAVGSVTGNPAVVVTTTTAGAALGAAAVEETPSQTDILETIPEEERADVAKTQAFWMFVEHFLEWIVGAAVALIAIAWLIPGPQTLWRRKDANSNYSGNRVRQSRTNRR